MSKKAKSVEEFDAMSQHEQAVAIAENPHLSDKGRAVAQSMIPPEHPPTAHTLPPSHDDDPYMSFSEVAAYLGKSPQTIMRWAHDGLIEFVRVGPLPKIRRSALAKFLGGTALQPKV